MNASGPHLLKRRATSGDAGGLVVDGGDRKNRNIRYGKRPDLHRRRKYEQQTESSTGKD